MALLSLFSFPVLWLYLNRRKPDVTLVCLLGFVPLLATLLSPHKPRNVLFVNGIPTFNRFRTFLWRHLHTRADLVITVTKNTGDLIRRQGMPAHKVRLMDHPVLDDSVLIKSREAVDHPWFTAKERPVIVGMGRLTRQKDFPTLLRAFARVRAAMACRLVIFGEGEDRQALAALIGTLGLGEDVWLAGFTPNPYRYVVRADLFVLSSRWEDPGHVIMEAAALKVPIVSTDCPSGPGEFLQGGALGHLVPVGDSDRMAEAMLDALRAPSPARVEGASRQAARYTVPACIDAYSAALGLTDRPNSNSESLS
jgi:glycosyltransferase involved in cell wall biosynthesis